MKTSNCCGASAIENAEDVGICPECREHCQFEYLGADVPTESHGIRTGMTRISTERMRQGLVEGWSPDHDDEHTKGELATAASIYAMAAGMLLTEGTTVEAVKATIIEQPWRFGWPWDASWLKLDGGPERCLEKAGALCASELDRLMRLNSQNDQVDLTGPPGGSNSKKDVVAG